MNTIEIFFDGILIDGITDEIVFTYSTNDLGSIDTRQGVYSNTIEIPLTNNNRIALGHSNSFSSISGKPKLIIDCQVYESGVLILSGFARINSSKDTITATIYSGNSNWYKSVSDSSLQELDLDDYNINFDGDGVNNNRLSTSNFVFPNVWYDKNIPSSYVFGENAFRPAFYVKDLLKKMIDKSGYSFYGELLEDELFKKCVIPYSNKYWKKRSFGKAVSFRPEVKTNIDIDVSTNRTFLGADIVYFKDSSKYLLFTGEWGIFTNGFYLSLDWFPMPNTEKILHYKVIMNSSSNQPSGIGATFKTAQVTNFGNLINEQSLTFTQFTNAGDYIFEGTFTSVENGTYPRVFFIEFQSTFTGQLNCKGGLMYYGGPEYEIEQTTNQWTDFAKALPDLKQSDLVITILNQFLVITSTDNISRSINFFKLETIKSNINKAKNWTSKIDLSEQPTIIFDFFENYFRRNFLKYKIDEKDPFISGTTIGQGYFDYENENVENQGDIFESEFSPIVRQPMFGKELALIPINGIDGDLSGKIGYVEITNDNLITLVPFPAPTQSAELFFDGIGFDVLIPTYCKPLQDILENSKVLKMLIRLSRADITNLDFSIPIFLDFSHESCGHVRGHFYINEISQYPVGSGSSCEVTLIQID
jgi:hypothetical protein